MLTLPSGDEGYIVYYDASQVRLGCVPDVGELRKEIMEEAHFSAYSIHLGSTKMHNDLKDTYWYNGIKKYIADFGSKCLKCLQVKLEHQRSSGLLQQLPIPEWKWGMIAMDIISELPCTSNDYNAIWMIVDRLTSIVLHKTLGYSVMILMVNGTYTCH